MRRRLTLLLVVLPLIFCSGCIAVFVEMFTDPMGRKAAFTRAQREYTKLLRWSEVHAAARFVHPETREEFLSYEGEFEGIRITDFDVGDVTFGESEATATVRVTYHAYSMASMLEKEIEETQEWERLGGDNQWVVRPKLEGLLEQVAELR
jgi:GTP cyclohydrolase III